MRITGWIIAAVLAVVASPTLAFAGSPTEQVRQYTEQVQKILAEPAGRQGDKRAAVRKIAGEVFDLTEAAKRALGRHWLTRTPAERQEFVELFTELLERTYMQKIDFYGGEHLRYTGETIDGDFAVVRARVITRQQTEIPVEAKLHQRDGRWLIYDLAVENVSLIANYRSQFDRIIRATSYRELITRLKAKRQEFLHEGVARSAPAS
jgi:phospholipid transport system substrate-binding protein